MCLDLLLNCYCFDMPNKKIKVRWGNTLSSSFNVGNGVKQGAILMPVLFNTHVYG